MVFEGDSVKDMLILYSTLVGTNTSAEETEHLFKKLVESVQAIDPDFVPHLGTSLTAYEAFLLVEKDTYSGNVTALLGDIEGYTDTTMEYTVWDPIVPVDDTQQYPDDECVERAVTPAIPCVLPERDYHVDTSPEFFQGDDIVGLLSDEMEEISLFDEHKPNNDTDQYPEDTNVSIVDRSAFSNEYAARDFI
ncbi:hypothetical protein FR483_N586L [Paramecium bursaria Chlorella virus FR483]|uniref:Uncharacterized protein N586L n=1 Tax=Paramecium bursaria Chlorella virus FR483 TaxID=399781 RepID=A7J7U0_PBCVF|nr:hypothetical protein FR483_N586L [Paramecium bursaria Chlorella virus FR483]ABT15871.1 hypothetical protein FR483_N586L [Paramecium bursaria Chlorella virus FR483]